MSTFFVAIRIIPRQSAFATGLPEDTVFEGGIAERFQLLRGMRGLPGWLRNSFKSNCFFGVE
jgi:hypothetical protein